MMLRSNTTRLGRIRDQEEEVELRRVASQNNGYHDHTSDDVFLP